MTLRPIQIVTHDTLCLTHNRCIYAIKKITLRVLHNTATLLGRIIAGNTNIHAHNLYSATNRENESEALAQDD